MPSAQMKPSEIVGFRLRAIHRGSSVTALFAAGCSEYSSTKLWPFVARARKRLQERSNPSKPPRRAVTPSQWQRNKMTEATPMAFTSSLFTDTTLDVFGVDVSFLVENEHTGGRFDVLEYVSNPGHEPLLHGHEHSSTRRQSHTRYR
jgi:hypothetical protein